MGAALVVGLVGVVWTRVAPFAVALAFVAYLSAGGSQAPRIRRWLAVVAAGVALAGLIRFTMNEALPGIVEGGKRASGTRAVSHLRQLLFAQDVLRQQAEIDPDGDRIGGAGFIEELSGRSPIRGSLQALSAPMAMARPGRIERVPQGPCLHLDGYCFIVCLPGIDGGWVADPEADSKVDEEKAERRFLAYAWPARSEEGLSASYFIDEHERILVYQGQANASYAGQHAPNCDAALSQPERWKPWRNKQPRQNLPGDRK